MLSVTGLTVSVSGSGTSGDFESVGALLELAASSKTPLFLGSMRIPVALLGQEKGHTGSHSTTRRVIGSFRRV